MRRRNVLILAGAALLAGCAMPPAADDAAPMTTDVPARALVTASTEAVQAFMTRPEWEGVRNLMAGSRAVLISPHQVRLGLILGVEQGAGIIMARHGDSWSDPVFVVLSNINLGFLGGISDSTTMMVILTQQGVQQFIDGSRRASGSGGFALGDWGAGGLGVGGMSGGAQALTVEASRGLFAGGGFGSARLRLDDDRNRATYGAGMEPSAILARPGGAMAEARPLRAQLRQAVRAGYGAPGP